MLLDAATGFVEALQNGCPVSTRDGGQKPSAWPRSHLPTTIDSALPLGRERELPWDCSGLRRGCGLPIYMSG